MKSLNILILEDSDRIPTIAGRFKSDAIRKMRDSDFAVYVASTGFVEIVKNRWINKASGIAEEIAFQYREGNLPPSYSRNETKRSPITDQTSRMKVHRWGIVFKRWAIVWWNCWEEQPGIWIERIERSERMQGENP